jgi:hypothetical protein
MTLTWLKIAKVHLSLDVTLPDYNSCFCLHVNPYTNLLLPDNMESRNFREYWYDAIQHLDALVRVSNCCVLCCKVILQF